MEKVDAFGKGEGEILVSFPSELCKGDDHESLGGEGAESERESGEYNDTLCSKLYDG